MNRSKKITPFVEVTRFHGHLCPGIAIGYRASEIAIKNLSSNRAIDEEFLAMVENDSCSVDAIQVVTGCTFGKGNLIFKDYGKNVYTFINRNTGNALRLSIRKNVDEIDPEFAILRNNFLNSANRENKVAFEKQKDYLSQKILSMDDRELFNIERVEIDIPQEARIFNSVKCHKCGEFMAEHRARVENGELTCIPCFSEYSRN